MAESVFRVLTIFGSTTYLCCIFPIVHTYAYRYKCTDIIYIYICIYIYADVCVSVCVHRLSTEKTVSPRMLELKGGTVAGTQMSVMKKRAQNGCLVV